MKFNTPIRVRKRDMLNAARHECAHAMIAASMGNRIYVVCIRRDGSGYCDIDIPASPIQNIRISIAGYCAERILGGYKPSYKAMKRDKAQSDDIDDIEWALNDGRVHRDKALAAAFDYVITYFEIPSNRQKLLRISKRLARTRVLFKEAFKS